MRCSQGVSTNARGCFLDVTDIYMAFEVQVDGLYGPYVRFCPSYVPVMTAGQAHLTARSLPVAAGRGTATHRIRIRSSGISAAAEWATARHRTARPTATAPARTVQSDGSTCQISSGGTALASSQSSPTYWTVGCFLLAKIFRFLFSPFGTETI